MSAFCCDAINLEIYYLYQTQMFHSFNEAETIPLNK